jgi:endoglucanase
MTQPHFLRWLAVVLIVVAAGITGYAVFASSKKVDQNIVFSSNTLLSGTWNSYKEEYWEDSTGRTLDKQQNNITTSEGQSYTMLRAVWMSDKTTFDKTWAWTQQQLQRQDGLFAWRWGQKSDGSYGVLTDQGGQNSASDADSDIAFALLMAAGKWQQQSYLDAAKSTIKGVWNQEIVAVNGKPYLSADNLEKQSQSPIVINPSYLAPYEYREFAKADTDHDWNAVVDSSYDLLKQATEAPLGSPKSANIVPDWVVMDRTTGALSAPTTGSLTTNYSYDAMRSVWRLGLDYEWNKDQRAKDLLSEMSFLGDQWKQTGKIYSTYDHAGDAVTKDEVAEAYGTAQAYFDIVEPTIANDVYGQKLSSLYDQDTDSWKQPLTYYASNWVWFGIGLHEHQLPNLVQDLGK